MRVMARICSYRIANGALAGGELPKRLKILDWGENPTAPKVGRRVIVGERTAELLPYTHQHEGWDRIALDFEHNSLPGTPEFERSQEPRKIAAYGVVVVVPGDGVFLDDLQWTPAGKENAMNYVDLSPAPVQTADGTVVGVHSVALCRHGAIDGLSFYSVDVPSKEEGKSMKAFWLKFLGLKDDATDEAVGQGLMAKIAGLCAEPIKGLEAKVTALSAAIGDPARITALSTDVAGLSGKVTDLTKSLDERDREDVRRQAAMEGKVIALSVDAQAKLTVVELREYVKGLPVTVPLSQRTPSFVQPLSVDAAAAKVVTDVDRQVAKSCGMAIEDYAKANGLKLVSLLLALGLAAGACFGAAATADLNTLERSGKDIGIYASSNIFYRGTLVCEDGNAVAVPAADASGYCCIGMVAEYLDNTGANYSSTKVLRVKRGVFRWTNGDSFTDANIGDLAYIEDNQTVQKGSSATYDIVAGVIIDVDSDGVWVDSFAIGGSGAASVTTLAASGAATLGSTCDIAGNATVGGTLGVTGVGTFTAESVHNGGIDCDYVTTDAGAGVDTKTAGALKIGAAMATSLDLGASDIITSVAGQFTAPRITYGSITDVSYTNTSSDYGKLMMVDTNTTVAIKLPANGAPAGSCIDFILGPSTDDTCAPTWSAATADTLIGPNDVDLDSVTYDTGHRIGAYLRVISDGTKWHAVNIGSTTMSGTD